MSLYTKFVNFIGKDIASESESKGLIVLIRIQTIVDFVYNAILAVLFLTWFDKLSAGVGLLFAVLHLGILALTYRKSTRQALFLYCILVAASTIFYCQYISPGLGFRYVIFAIIPLIYFKTDESWAFRLSWSTLSCIFSVLLAIAGLYLPAAWIINETLKSIFIIITTCFLAWKLMIISHFYYKKFSTDELKIIKYTQKLELLSTQDALTNLQNRRGMHNFLEKKIAASDENTIFTLAIGDIDFFKKVNDTYGHEAGDVILKNVSSIMSEFMKGKGRVARWGGEEFLLEFDMNGDQAFIEVEALRHLIGHSDFSYEGTPINVTMTFGVEEFSPLSPLCDSIDNADKKLYVGKESGRNRVIY